MIERPDQDASGVVTTFLGPVPQKWCEVTRVSSHEDAILFGRQFQHLWIVQRSKRRIRGEAQHVLALFLECRPDPPGGQVGVEEETHPQSATTEMNGNRMVTSPIGRLLSTIASAISTG